MKKIIHNYIQTYLLIPYLKLNILFHIGTIVQKMMIPLKKIRIYDNLKKNREKKILNKTFTHVHLGRHASSYAQKVTYIHQHSKTTCQFTTKKIHIQYRPSICL